MYIVRKAFYEDINSILKIYDCAKEFLKEFGVDQWQNNYPNLDIIISDINNSYLYVLEENKNILGVMAFIKEKEITYDKIYNGKWLSDSIYYTIHRISVKNKGKNLAKYFIDFAINECLNDNVCSLRIDTHSDNIVMRKFLVKSNFVYCGDIYLLDGSLRKAYEMVVDMKNEKIINQVFSSERALYNKKSIYLENCSFKGEEDGESALKECDDILINNTYFDLRYPLWHSNNITLNNINMTVNCRAPLWYSKEIVIKNSNLNCVKAVRECFEIKIIDSYVDSLEFGWKSKDIVVSNSDLNGEYMFLDSENIALNSVKFKGKYSFQYVSNLEISNCEIDTKDAFWHASNVLVKDSYIKGEYLGWYSKNLKFVNCVIEGTQALCYCDSLVLEKCKLVNCDLAFEYSSVSADIETINSSIKNPLNGLISLENETEVILENSKYESMCIIKNNK